MSLARATAMVRWWLLAALISCDVGDMPVAGDDYWDDATDDDGSDRLVLAAGANGRVEITAGNTQDAERIELVPVGRSENGATARVALQLTPAQLPRLAVGDRLIVPAELQVTTRCDIGQTAPGCNYNPNVRAQLILTGNATDTTAAGNSRVIATQQQSCTKNEHHCMIVFTPGEATIRVPDVPCVATGCFVNLVVTAWHPDARAGDQDKLIVGGNDGNFLDNGEVDADQARLMAIRERGITGADRAMRESSGSGGKQINTSANPELVYSHRLKSGGLKKGEQFVVEAKVAAEVGGRVRFSAMMFLTRDGNAADGNGLDKIEPVAINEHNGINCDAGSSCVLRKVAVFRVTEDVDDAVFVNLAVRSAVPGGGSERVTVTKGAGFVRVMRYAAALAD